MEFHPFEPVSLRALLPHLPIANSKSTGGGNTENSNPHPPISTGGNSAVYTFPLFLLLSHKVKVTVDILQAYIKGGWVGGWGGVRGENGVKGTMTAGYNYRL